MSNMFRLSALWERNAAEQDGEDETEEAVSVDTTSVTDNAIDGVDTSGSSLQVAEGGATATTSDTVVRPNGREVFSPDAAARRNASAARDRAEEPIREAEADNYAKELLSTFSIETIQDAVNYCSELITKQLERSREKHPAANAPIRGDLEARRATLTLLPDTFVRELFLRTTRDLRNWQRIKPLFGSPPYVFLRPEDAGFINASGISATRINMARANVGEIASYSQFGIEHLVDNHGREYRVVPTKTPHVTDPLPCDLHLVDTSQPILLNVRIPKRKRNERMLLFSNINTRRSVVFPQAGETLQMASSSSLKNVRGAANEKPVSRLQVRRVIARSATSSTAAVIGVVAV